MQNGKSISKQEGCPFKTTKQSLKDRPLLTHKQTNALSSLFKMLSNDTRLRILHALARKEEMCVSDLVDTVKMKLPAVSNQLNQLAARNIVASRRDGLQVFYRIQDSCVIAVLDHALCSAECSAARSAKGMKR